MTSELEVLKQRIIKLEAENAELRKENTVIPDLRRKISEFDAERAELKRTIAETLRMTEEERTRRDAENVKLRATIEELRKNNTKENAELRDRVTKVEQRQMLNDNTPNDNTPNDNTPNDNTLTLTHLTSIQVRSTMKNHHRRKRWIIS
jgi:septal ring factor EnvC (AmiA/AmiB activator)